MLWSDLDGIVIVAGGEIDPTEDTVSSNFTRFAATAMSGRDIVRPRILKDADAAITGVLGHSVEGIDPTEDTERQVPTSLRGFQLGSGGVDPGEDTESMIIALYHSGSYHVARTSIRQRILIFTSLAIMARVMVYTRALLA